MFQLHFFYQTAVLDITERRLTVFFLFAMQTNGGEYYVLANIFNKLLQTASGYSVQFSSVQFIWSHSNSYMMKYKHK